MPIPPSPRRALSGQSRSPTSKRKPDSLVFMLHGIGADGSDLIGLADVFARDLPDTAFFSPDAPHPFAEAPFGRQWYSRGTPQARVEGVRAVAPVVDAYVDELARQHGLPPGRCVLLGFSQGAIVSLHAAPRRQVPLAGVVALSGALVTGDTLAAEAANKAPILLVHGAADRVLPASGSQLAAAALEGIGVPAELHVLPDLGHAIDERVLRLAAAFMQRVLGAARPADPR